MLGWFDTREVDEFADSVVAELQQRFPPSGVDLSTRKAVDRVMKNVERLGMRVADFGRERKLNVYKKARFGNRIKWALKEAQYPQLFVDVMTQELVTQLALASRAPRGS
jgi:KaiC/GvpD/RAD55 family RecA-like ATPase